MGSPAADILRGSRRRSGVEKARCRDFDGREERSPGGLRCAQNHSFITELTLLPALFCRAPRTDLLGRGNEERTDHVQERWARVLWDLGGETQ